MNPPISRPYMTLDPEASSAQHAAFSWSLRGDRTAAAAQVSKLDDAARDQLTAAAALLLALANPAEGGRS